MKNYQWFAVYTRANAEKKFAERVHIEGIEAFLPLATVTRIWSDRKKIISEPLFKSHVFVYTNTEGLQTIKSMPGFSHFIRFGNHPTPIPDSQIIQIETIIQHFPSTSAVSRRWVKGESVAIANGPLKGMLGTLVEVDGEKKVAVDVTALQQSLIVTLPLSSVVKSEVIR
ncbi:transcription termination/antitermination protein NusG [Enterovibrio coralii]|uniref:NusG-like N-terminal domain-containing protein n=1 Tax=Enterovibrio coralii TaxID=294935 RepID=A0A135IA39_9GAMM|nr:UpxY family transcription antiterminator [Enterovibrio coralii]KXF82320.1 hypothetical protein ATN88_09145 [Enterovibrio coralii]